MSTGSSEAGRGPARGPSGNASGVAASMGEVTPAGRDASSTEGTSSSAALGLQTAAFVDEFERWAHRRAVEAGASLPRLRLLYSLHCNGPRKMADLADELAVTPRNVTALVDGLEADGLVRRLPHSTDRRVTLIELTCNSERVAAQFRAYRASLAGLFTVLSEEDRLALGRMITTLRERIDAAGPGSTAQKGAPDA